VTVKQLQRVSKKGISILFPGNDLSKIFVALPGLVG
jgi:hypothetical protein